MSEGQPAPDKPPDWAHSFGGVVDAYDRARPTYPREAAQWLVGQQAATVLELGAGTGKLTQQLVALGHGVVATDPDPAMLERLRRNLPDVGTLETHAEELPVGDHGFDVVVAAQAFHWFDADRALREAARMLKPEGRIALVWNHRDERIPWVRKLGRIIGNQDHQTDPTDVLVSSKLFGYVEDATFRFWQPLRKAELRDLVVSRSNVAVMDPMAQERLLRKVDELFDDYQTGPDGLLLPYITRCYRAVVRPRGLIEEPEHSADLTAAANAVREAARAEQAGADVEESPATTLIDFR
jgi:SAM-dependent methyltransferase